MGRMVGKKSMFIMALVAALVVPATPAAAQETCMGMPATKVGTEGDDFLMGTEGVDVIVGLGGNDIIRGLGGDDYLCGGNGRDRLFGGFGDDHVEGGKKNDIVKGDQGKDTLFGNQGNDRLFGGPGADVLEGGSGVRDKLFGKGASDICNDPQGSTIFDTCEGGDAAPKLGSTLRTTTPNGNPIDMTVHRVLDPATSINRFWDPAGGNRLVSVLVTLRPVWSSYSECGTTGISPKLRTSTGTLVESQHALLAEGPVFSGCSTVEWLDQSSGWLTFELRNGVQPVELVFGGSESVDLTAGAPTWPAGELLPGQLALGTAVDWNWPAAGEEFAITAHQIVDGATPAAGSRLNPGNRFVAVRVSYKNVGDSPARPAAAEGWFRVVTTGGFRHAFSGSGATTTAGSRIRAQENIAPGATASGWITFEIPVREQLERIDLKVIGGTAWGSWAVP